MKNLTIQSELDRRMNLCNDSKFIAVVAETVKMQGVTAEQWNENKALLLMMFANEFCNKENKN